MKVEIFHLAGQQQIVDELSTILRNHLYPDLSLFAHVVDQSEDPGKLGLQYVKLLHAAMPPGVKMDVTSLESYGRRIYFRVYYSLPLFPNTRDFHSLDTFFPAMALRDRMTFVPRGLSQELGKRDSWSAPATDVLTKSFEARGLTEVNFAAPAELTQAVKELRAQLQRDVLVELRNYALYHPLGQDLAAVAKHLDVDPVFIRSELQASMAQRGIYGDLTCDLDPQEITWDRWTRLSLSIRNDSEEELTDLEISLAGPVQVLPSRLVAQVGPRSTQKIAVAVKSTERGEFPLEIVCALPGDKLLAQWLPARYFWIRCV